MSRHLKENSPLTEVFSFRTTTDLAETWRDKIARSGETASEFFRRAVQRNETTIIGDASKVQKRRATRIKQSMPTDIRRFEWRRAQGRDSSRTDRSGTYRAYCYQSKCKRLGVKWLF
jgi:hypothetical protein